MFTNFWGDMLIRKLFYWKQTVEMWGAKGNITLVYLNVNRIKCLKLQNLKLVHVLDNVNQSKYDTYSCHNVKVILKIRALVRNVTFPIKNNYVF